MDDLEFLQRCVKGEKPAWDEFVERYSRLIYNYIYGVLNAKGCSLAQNDIQDIFQEIISHLIKDNFKKLKTFKAKNGCSLASWLRQVTINFTIDYLRKNKPTVSLEEETEEGFSLKELLADNSPTITDTLSHQERLKNLKDCIERLDTDDKYFLELYLNRALSLEEIREHLQLSRAAIDMRKSRLIERLRGRFKKKGFALDS